MILRLYKFTIKSKFYAKKSTIGIEKESIWKIKKQFLISESIFWNGDIILLDENTCQAFAQARLLSFMCWRLSVKMDRNLLILRRSCNIMNGSIFPKLKKAYNCTAISITMYIFLPNCEVSSKFHDLHYQRLTYFFVSTWNPTINSQSRKPPKLMKTKTVKNISRKSRNQA